MVGRAQDAAAATTTRSRPNVAGLHNGRRRPRRHSLARWQPHFVAVICSRNRRTKAVAGAASAGSQGAKTRLAFACTGRRLFIVLVRTCALPARGVREHHPHARTHTPVSRRQNVSICPMARHPQTASSLRRLKRARRNTTISTTCQPCRACFGRADTQLDCAKSDDVDQIERRAARARELCLGVASLPNSWRSTPGRP
jgi:hypothetical protein